MTPSKSNWQATSFCMLLAVIRQATSGLDLVSLLMVVPLIVCLVPVLDSLQGQGVIRIWDRWSMRFQTVERAQNPWKYWINLIVGWPATGFFSYALVMVPKQ